MGGSLNDDEFAEIKIIMNHPDSLIIEYLEDLANRIRLGTSSVAEHVAAIHLFSTFNDVARGVHDDDLSEIQIQQMLMIGMYISSITNTN